MVVYHAPPLQYEKEYPSHVLAIQTNPMSTNLQTSTDLEATLLTSDHFSLTALESPAQFDAVAEETCPLKKLYASVLGRSSRAISDAFFGAHWAPRLFAGWDS